MTENEKLYKPGETAKKLDVTTMTLNKWVQYFGIETEWSNPNNPENKGHRRYTQNNLETLVKIKEKVQNQNWSWEKTKAFLNGDETVDVQLRTGLEMEISELRKELKEDREKNQHFQESLLGALEKMTGKLNEVTAENEKLEKLIQENNKTKLLDQEIDKQKEEREVVAEKQSLLTRFFRFGKEKKQG